MRRTYKAMVELERRNRRQDLIIAFLLAVIGMGMIYYLAVTPIIPAMAV